MKGECGVNECAVHCACADYKFELADFSIIICHVISRSFKRLDNSIQSLKIVFFGCCKLLSRTNNLIDRKIKVL